MMPSGVLSLSPEALFTARFCLIMLMFGLIIDVVPRVLIMPAALALVCVAGTDQAVTPIAVLMGVVVMNFAVVVRNYTLRAQPIQAGWWRPLSTRRRAGDTSRELNTHSQGQ